VIELNSEDIDAFYKSIGVLVKQNSLPNLQKPQIDLFLKLIQDSLAKCLESSTGICTEKFSQELLAMVNMRQHLNVCHHEIEKNVVYFMMALVLNM
jgi:hypothetical protein